jgi:diaminopimelate decarboxylase
MHNFEYRQGELYCEQVPVSQIAKEVGTPCYIYSHATLTRHFRAYDSAFKNIPHIIAYAMKANSNLAILRLMAKEGSGVDIVSGGELFRALKAGVPPEKIVFAGVGKNADEIRDALKADILMFNVESSAELQAINDVAASVGKKARVALRINPDIDPKTHPYISTGLKKSKFGIAADRALEEFNLASSLDYIEVVGVHAHIGSQLTEVTPFIEALKKVVKLVESLKGKGINIRYLNIGGGLGITYSDEKPPLPQDLADAISPLVQDLKLTLVMEPGRVIVGNAGILVTKALYEKVGEAKRFIIVDAAMNDLIRPSLYSAYHEIRPVSGVVAATTQACRRRGRSGLRIGRLSGQGSHASGGQTRRPIRRHECGCLWFCDGIQLQLTATGAGGAGKGRRDPRHQQRARPMTIWSGGKRSRHFSGNLRRSTDVHRFIDRHRHAVQEGQVGRAGVRRFDRMADCERARTGSCLAAPPASPQRSRTTEHHRVVKLAVEVTNRRVPVIAGTGSNSTAEAVSLTRHAKEAGADGALLITPYYNKPMQEGLYRHYKAVAEAVDLPSDPLQYPESNWCEHVAFDGCTVKRDEDHRRDQRGKWFSPASLRDRAVLRRPDDGLGRRRCADSADDGGRCERGHYGGCERRPEGMAQLVASFLAGRVEEARRTSLQAVPSICRAVL